MGCRAKRRKTKGKTLSLLRNAFSMQGELFQSTVVSHLGYLHRELVIPLHTEETTNLPTCCTTVFHFKVAKIASNF